MSPAVFAYGALFAAILCEVAASSLLQKTEQFTRLIPTLAMGALYVAAFYLLSHALKAMPLGVAYAIWAGLGIVLTAVAGAVLYRQSYDAPAMLGMGLIVSGVVVMQAFSQTAGH